MPATMPAMPAELIHEIRTDDPAGIEEFAA